MSSYKKYLNNTYWLFLEKILRLISSFAIGIWVARYLGPEQFGLLSYAISFSGFFVVLATLGLDVVLVKELNEDQNNKNLILGSSFYLKVFNSVLLLLILLLILFNNENNIQTNLLIFIISLSILFQSFTVIDFYFQSKVLAKYSAISNIYALIISSIYKIILILLNLDIIYFASAILLESIVLSFFLVFFHKKQGQKISEWQKNFKIAKTLLNKSWPLILSGFIFTVYMKIDQIMIKEILDTTQVGYYAAAARLSESWYFIATVITTSFFPAILNAKKISSELYLSRLQKLYDLMVGIAVLISIPVTIFAKDIIIILFGSEFKEAGDVLIIHIWSGIFVFLAIANGKWIVTENLQKYLILNTFIGAFTNVILNYILIKKIGIVGAAYATLISYFLASYFCLIFFSKTRIAFFSLTKSLFNLRIFKFNYWRIY